MSDPNAWRTVVDELEIRNVLALIAQRSDDGSLDGYGEMFTDAARWQMAATSYRGREQIVAAGARRRETGEAGPGSNSRHVITTVSIAVDGDQAVAESYWLFYVDTDKEPVLRSMGKYRDCFERTAVGWRLGSREISLG